MPRHLPEEFFDNPEFRKFMASIVRDRELFPEIRNGSLTVYYRGAGLIRDLRVKEGQIVGQVHFKYIPVRSPQQSDYVTLQLGAVGLSLPQDLAPLSIGFGDSDVLSEYKRTMKSVSHNLECLIVHEVVCRPENLILDQEVKFQVSGEAESDKIDICHFDTHLNCLAFVEVKGIHDPRLEPGPDDVPEVVHQLRRYRLRIEQQQAVILEDYKRVVALKSRLGLAERLNGIPSDGPGALLKKPILVIGHCSRDDVQAIVGRHDEWVSLVDGLRECAAGLILCGRAGCRLNLERGRQVIVFDETTF